ncbi:hypothetical protein RUM43_008660 [Polyplax serrata]|uniref:Uncharacterized protein n=1 Tax=Polyplax serrata TaxID=468196 RepID=A0AAN8S852_POLSC
MTWQKKKKKKKVKNGGGRIEKNDVAEANRSKTSELPKGFVNIGQKTAFSQINQMRLTRSVKKTSSFLSRGYPNVAPNENKHGGGKGKTSNPGKVVCASERATHRKKATAVERTFRPFPEPFACPWESVRSQITDTSPVLPMGFAISHCPH